MNKYYENKNAKTNCPECDSLNTYYKKHTLICNSCGYTENMKPSKKLLQMIGAVALTATVLILTFLTL